MAIEPDPHLSSAHAYAEQHPIVEPMELGGSWRWCYAHEAPA